MEYSTIMFHVAFEILRDNGLAEDAVHESFLNLGKRSFKVNNIYSKSTKGFMLVVVRNVAINIYNKRKKAPQVFEGEIFQLIDDQPLPLDAIISHEMREDIKNLLETLDPIYADVVLLKYYKDYSCADIANLLGVSKETVWTRLHRAKKLLAAKLIEGAPGNEKIS